VAVNSGTIVASTTGATYQWLNCPSYTQISGATSQSFTPATSGTYAVAISANGCSDTSVCTPVIATKLEYPGSQPQFSVFPNPSAGTFHISGTKPLQDATLVVINKLGRVVYRQQYLNGKEIVIRLALPPDTYFAVLNDADSTSVLKLEIVQ